MIHDKVPAVVAASAAMVSPEVLDVVTTGPKEGEWKSALVGLVVLAIREFVWWFRNRRA